MLARDCLEVSEEQGKIPEEPHRRLSTLEVIGVESLSYMQFVGLCGRIFDHCQSLQSLLEHLQRPLVVSKFASLLLISICKSLRKDLMQQFGERFRGLSTLKEFI